MTLFIPSKEKIASFLMYTLDADSLIVQDDSKKHQGHYPQDLKHPHLLTHVTLYIQSVAFSNLSLIQQHRKIYQLLDPFLKNGLHAISIKTI